MKIDIFVVKKQKQKKKQKNKKQIKAIDTKWREGLCQNQYQYYVYCVSCVRALRLLKLQL